MKQWAREHMKVIVTGIVAVSALAAGIVIASTIVSGELSSITAAILTTLFGPTIAALVSLLTSENVEQRMKRLEQQQNEYNGKHGRVKK